MNRLRRRLCHRNYIQCRLCKRHIQQFREPTAGLDLGTGPVGIIWPFWSFKDIFLLINRPNLIFRSFIRQIDEENSIEPLRSAKFRRHFGNIVRRTNDKTIRFPIIEPRKQSPENSCGNSAVVCAGRDCLLHFVDHRASLFQRCTSG